MRDEHDMDSERELDADVLHALKGIYAAPPEASYWESLESRIRTRVTAGATEWWSFFGGWTRMGLAAAGIAAVALGVAMARSRTEEARLAYEAVIDVPAGVPVPAETISLMSNMTTRDATLRYVFSH
jgi:hypothetical protein